jgi:hypothetical protein
MLAIELGSLLLWRLVGPAVALPLPIALALLLGKDALGRLVVGMLCPPLPGLLAITLALPLALLLGEDALGSRFVEGLSGPCRNSLARPCESGSGLGGRLCSVLSREAGRNACGRHAFDDVGLGSEPISHPGVCHPSIQPPLNGLT